MDVTIYSALFAILFVSILADVGDIQVRLVDGDNAANGDYISGRLEVTVNGTWGVACDDMFDKNAALVVCRKLGYTMASAVHESYFMDNAVGKSIYLDNVECKGTETNLAQCRMNAWGENDCKKKELVSIYCYNDTAKVFHIELVNGKNTSNVYSGRLAVALGKMPWGSVCDDLFTDKAASVTCKHFNYKFGRKFPGGTYGMGDRTYMDEVLCNGNETSLLSCSHSSWQEDDCGNIEDVGVACFNSAATLRTKNTAIDYLGTVHMWKLNKGYVEICDEGWDDVDARVACRELGFEDGLAACCSALDTTPWGSFTYNGAYSNVSCTGTEASILDCPMTSSGVSCELSKSASAVCFNTTVDPKIKEFAVRFVDGDKYWGRVEVRHLGVWLPICTQHWSDTEADVVCKMQGFAGGKRYGEAGTSDLPPWLTHVACKGNESSLLDCELSPWGRTVLKCDAAYAICYDKNITVSLMSLTPAGKSYGRVVVNYDDTEGTICNTGLTDTEAMTICKDIGYNGGRLMELNDQNQFNGPIFISNLQCKSNAESMFSCKNSGWNVSVPECSSHNQDLAVHCYKNVRLSPGLRDAGAVQIYDNGWKSVCGKTGFDNKEAEVICKEIGFTMGRALPAKVFGYVNGPHVRPGLDCFGNETSLLNCPYNKSSSCYPSRVSYASVSCANKVISTDRKYKLEGSAIEDPSYGRVRILEYNTFGYVCNKFWTDVHANILCKELNYAGGVAFRENGDIFGPFFINKLNCTGAETALADCKKEDELCDLQVSGGVLCHKTQAPRLRLNPPNSNRGRIEIVLDNDVGRICADKWDHYDAAVACINLGYNYGSALTYPKSKLPIFLSSLICLGNEPSLFKCSNPGWKIFEDSVCLNDEAKDAGALCFKTARLMEGEITEDYANGKLTFYDQGEWKFVCDKGFDHGAAQVVCKEMGYTEGIVLKGERERFQPSYVLNISCTGTETDVGKCSYKTGFCENYKAARISCFHSRIASDVKYHLENGFSGRVLVENYGQNGTICEEGWDDNDANVLCKTLNYAGGVAYGVKSSSVHELVWFGNTTCTGFETDFKDCPRNPAVSPICRVSGNSAGVLCYQTSGVDVRLKNGGENYGRVEVLYDGVWGTVCDQGWSRYDARTLCKQLGFVEGLAYAKSRYGSGTGPVYIENVRCRMDDLSFLACPNNGFNKTSQYCGDHENDASVYCYYKIRLVPGPTYGYLDYWTGSSYLKVCEDDFTDTNANIACRELGYAVGKPIYGSAFEAPGSSIATSGIKCTGQESKFENCLKDDTSMCDSNQYVSIVCSNVDDKTAYTIGLNNVDSGRVIVNHMQQTGYVCGNDFSQHDANVICREAGYYSGLPYKYGTERSNRYVTELRWFGNMSCSGDETAISECSNFNWGKLHGCDLYHDAAAVCFKNAELAKVDFRLKGGASASEGRVEILINGTWGSICGLDMSGETANVLCKHLGYTSGAVLGFGSKWRGTGPLHINKMICDENATSIYDCSLSGFGQDDLTCDTRYYDAAINCFSSARIAGGLTGENNFGRAEILTDNTWYPVCDTTFDDSAARIMCQQFGFADGSTQCCSSLGSLPYRPSKFVTKVECRSGETNISNCAMEYGNCPGRNYVSVFCRNDKAIQSTLPIKLSEGTIYSGVVNVSRNGVWGSVCSDGFTDMEAKTACKQLNFVNGFAIKPHRLPVGSPYVMGNVSCSDTASRLDTCKHDEFGDNHGCKISRTAAKVLCSASAEPIKYRINGGGNIGRAEIYFNGEWGLINKEFFGQDDANVFCKEVGFISGEVHFPHQPVSGGYTIKLSKVECEGTETNFLQCGGNWDTEVNRQIPTNYGIYVNCHKPVRIERGDTNSNGIIKVHNGDEWGTICSDQFTDTDATVACKQLGFQDGRQLCCAPYGFNFDDAIMADVKCTGNEKDLLDCPHTSKGSGSLCLRQTYASIACFNETVTNEYKVSLAGGSRYTGSVNIQYGGVDGRICTDGWDDTDALVVCRELGYTKGKSYQHYKSSFQFFGYSGPYWTSNVNCTGTERRLGDCPQISFGDVKECKNKHYAGVLCYDDSEIFYQLGGGGDQYGRVEVSVNGNFGTICDRFWDKRDASVFCKTMGYVDGDTYSEEFNATGRPSINWESNLQCSGSEKNINDCPHEGWLAAKTSYCKQNISTAGAFCYTGVKLMTGVGKKHGPVQIFHDEKWVQVCDKGFTDKSAAVVCRELGFEDGKAICCSAYGDGSFGGGILKNKTMRCNGNERFTRECLRDEACDSGLYASVACIKKNTVPNESYIIKIDTPKNSGKLTVEHLGVTGRICHDGWTDEDAKVACKARGYVNGMAYKYSTLGTATSSLSLGPYWMSNFNCDGTEDSLLNCKYKTRLSLGNCSDGYTASVLCFNSTAIEYRIADGSDHTGRVEISIGGVWGTVCNSYWDSRDARVFCRQQKFNDGVVYSDFSKYGKGTGPIWLSHLQCHGTEESLHRCPHRGFNNDFSSSGLGWPFSVPCSTHDDDAMVFCYKNARLNQVFGSKMGGLEVFHDKKWTGVCDTGMDNIAATIGCQSLGQNFTYGLMVRGSAYSKLKADDIGISKIVCTGNENDISECTITAGDCDSTFYAGVICSETPFNDTGFQIRLAEDRLSQQYHGIMEVNRNGVWGRICMQGWDNEDANVACKTMGYGGGVAYLHIVKNNKAMLIRNVTCGDDVTDFKNCYYDESPDLEKCAFDSNDAGVVCYNGAGIQYRLSGGEDASTGRVEIGYDGSFGTVCSWAWNTKNARVFCKGLGYKDGVPRYEKIPGLPPLQKYLNGVFCNGEESTVLTCLNSGFNSTLLDHLCTSSGYAYSSCYNDEIKFDKVRLAGSSTDHSGRVEVYVEGPNEWGTVCDDYWDKKDADIVCKQLGWDGGVVVKASAFALATGPIWLDNVECVGNETNLNECVNRGIGTHNCNHTEDAAVECYKQTTPVAIIPTSTREPVTTRAPTATSPPTTPTPSTSSPSTFSQKQTTKPQPGTEPATEPATQPPTQPQTPSSTEKAIVGGASPQTTSASTIAVAIIIPIIVLIIIVVGVIAFLFYRKRRFVKGNNIAHERFHDDIIEQTHDGSISMSNQLFDMNMSGGNEPVDPLGDSSGYNPSSEITIGENGYAHFAKTPPLESNGNGDSGFSNPLYNMTPAETIMSEPAKLDVHDQDNGHSQT